MRPRYLMELTLLLRRTCRIAIPAGAKFFFASGVIALAGCSDVPRSYNPIDWGKSAVSGAAGMFDSKPDKSTAGAEPPPAEGRPYPNLATVPNPPPRPTAESRARYQQDVAELTADRERARAADAALRETGTVPKAPPEPAK